MENRKRYQLVLKCTSLLVGLLFSFLAVCQQEAMYTQNNFDRLTYNPAYAGSGGWIVTSLKHRSQFIGMEGAPNTQIITFHAPWQVKSMGFGAKVINDHLGATTNFSLTGIYAYHMGLGKGKLSAGIEGGIFSQTIDFASLYRIDKIDNAIPPAKSSVFKPDASFGVQFQSNNYFLGFSIVHLLGGKLNYTDDRDITARLRKHYFFSGGIVKDIGKNLSIQPCFLIKKVAGASTQMDLYVNTIFREKFTLGIGYRTSDAMTFSLKYHITDAIRVSYSYDHRISSIAKYSSGAHEIMIRYGIKLLPPQQIKEINPRYYF